MGQTAAVYYEAEAYQTSGERLLGRQAAGESFLKGLVRHGRAETLYCFARTKAQFNRYCEQIQPWASRPRRVTWLPTEDPGQLSQAGTLYRPDPDIVSFAWHRRFLDQRAYSLCGVTHTIASKPMQSLIGQLMLGPVQPWDAVICTSQAVRRAFEHVFAEWGDYLGQRLGAVPAVPVQLPVIPLGIDVSAFPTGEAAQAQRQVWRDRLGIPSEDVVVLFVGRLIFYAKGHPVPMYLALERAAQATGRRVHLVQAGWFEEAREEAAFKAAPAQFCPSVTSHFLDGRQPDVRHGIWSAADIFCSLSDNVQETFGLTPIEAMASGLPLVVSDWDGYQESLQHGVEGFKIPTGVPPAGAGRAIAQAYSIDEINYSTYIAHPAMATWVDVDACTQAFIELIQRPELRQQMGARGRQRAEAVYDWRHIIGRYEDLWANLAEIRASDAPEVAPLSPGRQPNPLCQDPFALFAHYAPMHLADETRIQQGSGYSLEMMDVLTHEWMSRFGGAYRLPLEMTQTLLASMPSAPDHVSVQALWGTLQESGSPVDWRASFERTLGYLLKFNLIRCANEPSL